MERVSKNLWFYSVCCTFMLQIRKQAKMYDDLLIHMLHKAEVVHIRKCHLWLLRLSSLSSGWWGLVGSRLRNISSVFLSPYFWITQMTIGKAGRYLEIGFFVSGLPWWLSWQRIHLQGGRPEFDPWVGKISWRRERQPTPVFWPGEFHGLYSPWGRKESDMIEQLSLSLLTINK